MINHPEGSRNSRVPTNVLKLVNMTMQNTKNRVQTWECCKLNLGKHVNDDTLKKNTLFPRPLTTITPMKPKGS